MYSCLYCDKGCGLIYNSEIKLENEEEHGHKTILFFLEHVPSNLESLPKSHLCLAHMHQNSTHTRIKYFSKLILFFLFFYFVFFFLFKRNSFFLFYFFYSLLLEFSSFLYIKYCNSFSINKKINE
jgi:hypothetical protein